MDRNNCATCKHRDSGTSTGWCYMFREQPQDLCMQHQDRYPQSIAARNPKLGLALAVVAALTPKD